MRNRPSITPKHCIGCFVFNTDGLTCETSYQNNGDCPCTECLVKTMCKTSCFTYNRYADEFRKKLHTEFIT
jgi:hypothetical protein